MVGKILELDGSIRWWIKRRKWVIFTCGVMLIEEKADCPEALKFSLDCWVSWVRYWLCAAVNVAPPTMLGWGCCESCCCNWPVIPRTEGACWCRLDAWDCNDVVASDSLDESWRDSNEKRKLTNYLFHKFDFSQNLQFFQLSFPRPRKNSSKFNKLWERLTKEPRKCREKDFSFQ